MKMQIKLNAPGMTSLHKAGLAGLYMTLSAFDERKERIDGLTWALEPKQVTLEWDDGKIGPAFEQLVRKSFWVDKEGFIRLAGLEAGGEPTPDQKHHLYTALLNSFLQHPQHKTMGKKHTLTYEVDDRVHWIKEFAPVQSFNHQQITGDFVDRQGQFRQWIEAAGWLYPGGGQRHVPYANTKLNESLEAALALLFAPVGVVFYTVKSRVKGRKARLVMLIPEVQDLEEYAEIRQSFAAQGTLALTASGTSDAALRLLIHIESSRAANQFAAFSGGQFLCRVVTFGTVDWSKQQKSRTYARTVFSSRLVGLDSYRKAAAVFKNRWQRSKEQRDRKGRPVKPESYFVTTYSARELIADNIAQGRAWYHDITTYMSQRETREALLYERKEMNQMVENASFEDESERTFIRVCHESWRKRLGKLGERARTENTNFQSLVRKEAEKLRTSLARCKNAETLRETVVDFWSRAGVNEHLQGDGLLKLLPLLGEKNWRKSRDLALLALISYQPQNAEEAAALKAGTAEEGDEEES